MKISCPRSRISKIQSQDLNLHNQGSESKLLITAKALLKKSGCALQLQYRKYNHFKTGITLGTTKHSHSERYAGTKTKLQNCGL